MDISISDRLYFRGLTAKQEETLREHFCIPNPAYANVERYCASGTKYTNVPEYIYADTTEGDAFTLPRGVTIPEGLLPAKWFSKEIRDERVRCPVKFPAPALTLNKMQKKLHAAFQECASEEDAGYLVHAGTAFGKTIAMLRMAVTTGQRTLILIHRDLIMKAWLADIRKFFGDNADVGIIRGRNSRIGKHFTVAMLQTMCRKSPQQLQQLYSNFGTVILDEAHICPAPFIRGVVSGCPALYRIGGTATLHRRDGLMKLVYWTFGKPFFACSDAGEVSGNQVSLNELRLVRTSFCYEPEDEEAFDTNEMNEQLFRDGARNRLIVKKVIADLREGHHVLVTCARKAHCHILVRRLLAAGEKPILLTGDRATGREQYERDVKDLQRGKRKLVVATEQLIKEGANIPPLDRLHITVPSSNRGGTVQLCGRICRASKATHKTDAKVTVYFDIRTPSLRRRVTRVVIPALRKLGVPNIQEMFIA